VNLLACRSVGTPERALLWYSDSARDAGCEFRCRSLQTYDRSALGEISEAPQSELIELLLGPTRWAGARRIGNEQ